MNPQECHLTLEQATAGMTLARNLLDAKGRVLMPHGTQLSAATITVLARRDVTKLWVLLETPTQATDIKSLEAAQRQHHKERLARLFRHVGENPDGRHLMNLMAHYREVELS